MKTYKLLFLLLIALAFNSCNKKSYYSQINPNSEFKYEYVFSFEDTTTSRVKIEKKEVQKSMIKGVMSDKNGTMPHCYIQLIGIDKNFKKTVEVDFDGQFKQEIPKGKYIMQTSSSMSEHLNFEFELEENTELNFDIYLKSRQLPAIYEINSKIPLSKSKIEEIKNCVKENWEGKVNNPCEEKDENYYISIQI